MTPPARKDPVALLSLAALGVVFGDIGTSPLYAMKEVFGSEHHPVTIEPANVLGILSLVVWSLLIVVSIKYVALIMRADNNGEGGIMALMARVLAQKGLPPRLAESRADAGTRRRRAVLRRRRDHAGDLGPFRRRGARGRHAGVQAVRDSDHARHSRGTCSRSRNTGRRSSAWPSARSWRCGSCCSPCSASCRSSITRWCWPRSGPAMASRSSRRIPRSGIWRWARCSSW